MIRPSNDQAQAAATTLQKLWDADGAKSLGEQSAYQEWGFGIADMILHGADARAVADYLAILEEQIGVPDRGLAFREAVALALISAVESASPRPTVLPRRP